jgi:FkbM family methyltransferase
MNDTAHTIDLEIAGKPYSMSSDDTYLAAHQGVFEPETVALLAAVADGANIAMDVGANVGCTALALSGIAREVHAFEASPSTHHWLAMNTKVAGNVTTHCIGLGDKHTFNEITFAEDNRSGGFVSNGIKATPGHVTERIEIRRMDDVVKHYKLAPVDFMKIDVEGFELRVLVGAKKTLKRFQPNVMLEMNHWCLNALHRITIPDFIDALCKTFPIVLVVDNGAYLDLHDPVDRYRATYQHLVEGKYKEVVCGFSKARLGTFLSRYSHA